MSITMHMINDHKRSIDLFNRFKEVKDRNRRKARELFTKLDELLTPKERRVFPKERRVLIEKIRNSG